MAMTKTSLKDRIEAELQNQGFVLSGSYAWVNKLALALANAIVDEIQINARCSGNDNPSGDSHNNVQVT